jgi:hypothetical protein
MIRKRRDEFHAVKRITLPDMMRGLAILFVTFVALAMVRGQSHFVPRLTAPMPAVNAP